MGMHALAWGMFNEWFAKIMGCQRIWNAN